MNGFLIMVYSLYNYYPLYLAGTRKEALDICHNSTQEKLVIDIKESFGDNIFEIDYVCIIEFKEGKAGREEVIITDFPSVV